MAKGSGTTRSSSSSNPKGIQSPKIAGDYGFKVLGKKESVMSLSGWSAEYSYQPNQSQLAKHVQEYLDTGKFDMYGSKGKSVIAKKIAQDLRIRGAHVNANGNYVETYSGLKITLTKKKDGTWKASESNASDNSGYSMTDALMQLGRKRYNKK